MTSSSSSSSSDSDNHSTTSSPPSENTSTAHALTPWMQSSFSSPSSSDVTTTLQLLDLELSSFLTYILPTQDEKRARTAVVRLFMRLVQSLWSDSLVAVYGSSSTGIFLPTADLDLTIESDSILHIPTRTLLNTLRDLVLSTHFAKPDSIQVIYSARIPILKFTTTDALGAFDCDVSINSSNGTKGAKEMARILDSLGPKNVYRVMLLLLALKLFLRNKKCSEVKTGGIGGLSAFCMVVSFIQIVKLPEPSSLGNDLIKFFYYYGFQFNNDTSVIFTEGDGSIRQKSDLGWSRVKSNRLSIQHPVDADRDLSAGSYRYGEIKKAFRDASASLVAYNNLLIKETDETSVSPPSSALASIGITVSSTMMEKRKLVSNLWTRGSLKELLTHFDPTLHPHFTIATSSFTVSPEPLSPTLDSALLPLPPHYFPKDFESLLTVTQTTFTTLTSTEETDTSLSSAAEETTDDEESCSVNTMTTPSPSSNFGGEAKENEGVFSSSASTSSYNLTSSSITVKPLTPSRRLETIGISRGDYMRILLTGRY